jgi:acid phosphatase
MVFLQYAAALVAAAHFASAAPQFLAPEQDINFPSSATATNPLRWLGANGPWASGKSNGHEQVMSRRLLSKGATNDSLAIEGPNVFDISPDIPEGCTVDQAAYISRHGSRYPDTAAYDEWLELYERVNAHTCEIWRPRK